MLSVKPGRGPSMMGGFALLGAAAFALLWTVFAIGLTREVDDGFGFVRILFPGFGVIFVLMALGGAVYNFRNAGAKERLSIVDIATATEEGDPLNRWAAGAAESSVEKSVEVRFKELQRLREKGLISSDEEKAQRARILGEV
jgi:hypothetical protein